MAAAPLRTALNDTYPAPSNSVFKTGIGVLWDFLTGLLGITGNKEDALTALRILSPDAIHNLSLVPSVAASALTMNVKTRAGAAPSATDPVMVGQRNATLGSGDFTLRTITAACSLVISSGSTLGHTDGVAGTIYWYLLDNAGAQELAASSAWFGESGIVSTTAEGGIGGADSATVMYSATARASLPFRFIGSTLDTQTTAGTWAALPSAINLILALGTMATQDASAVAITGGTMTGVHLRSKSISATRDMTAASGSVAYTGVGFTPSKITAYANVAGLVAKSVGVDNLTTKQVLITGEIPARDVVAASFLIYIYSSTAAAFQNFAITSMDADGFTGTWIKGNIPAAGTCDLLFFCEE